jgi:hypothetical protein
MIRCVETRNLIGGGWCSSPRSIAVDDPATDQVIAEVPACFPRTSATPSMPRLTQPGVQRDEQVEKSAIDLRPCQVCDRSRWPVIPRPTPAHRAALAVVVGERSAADLSERSLIALPRESRPCARYGCEQVSP